MSISTQYKHNKPICDTGERVIPCKDCPTGSRNLLNLYTVNPKADAALIRADTAIGTATLSHGARLCTTSASGNFIGMVIIRHTNLSCFCSFKFLDAKYFSH